MPVAMLLMLLPGSTYWLQTDGQLCHVKAAAVQCEPATAELLAQTGMADGWTERTHPVPPGTSPFVAAFDLNNDQGVDIGDVLTVVGRALDETRCDDGPSFTCWEDLTSDLQVRIDDVLLEVQAALATAHI